MWMRAARHLCAGTAFALVFGLAAPAGAEVASGWRNDFDANGVADLVVGSPGDTDCGFEAGGVNLIPGSVAGLTSDGSERRASCGFRDGYATALAAGDFDGDGRGDLAVGVPYGDGPGGPRVEVHLGSPTGLVEGPTIDAGAVVGPTGTPYAFGTTLSAGDFDRDGTDDLVIGHPEHRVAGKANAGGVLVVPGSRTGLRTGSARWITQATPGVRGDVRSEARFGDALEARGDYNSDGSDDLAVGVSGLAVDRAVAAGGVQLLYGRKGHGLHRAGSMLWTQGSPGVPDVPDAADGAGLELAKGDFDADGRDDLAVGYPGEDLSTLRDAGAVLVLRGSRAGLTGKGSTRWTQRSAGIPGAASEYGAFGHALAAANFGRNRPADLAISSRDGDPTDAADRASVTVLYGTKKGIRATAGQRWQRTTPGMPGEISDQSLFGEALAAANYGKRTYADLAIGVPGAGRDEVGEVRVLYGSTGGLSLAEAEVWHLDSPGVGGESGGDLRCCFGLSLL
jgi:hypothetical protein